MLPPSVQKLINQFSKLPSVGPRQAARFVFYLIRQPKEEIKEFADSLLNIKNIKKCSLCNRVIDVGSLASNICDICKNPQRDKSLICIVEKDTDIEAIEKTNRYNGLYYVLGGTKVKDVKAMAKRIKKDKKIKEVIIATSATTEGDTIALYISRLLKPYSHSHGRFSHATNSHGRVRIAGARRAEARYSHAIKITRLGRGLSTGSELEYVDEETLSQALLGRK